MGKRSVSITRKVNMIIVGTLFVGIGALTAFLSLRLSTQIQNDTTAALESDSTIIYESIRVLMLSGRALSLQQFTQNLNARLGGTTVQVIRGDGTLAFRDNLTIETVNDRLGRVQFEPREPLEPLHPAMMVSEFQAATSMPPAPQEFTIQENDQWIARIYRPLLNTPLCFRCHGTDHLVRGVVDVRTNITASISERDRSIIIGGLAFVLITLGIGLILAQFMRRTVIRPIQLIRDVCVAVTEGDFMQQVHVRSNDEVGSLGETVNTMVTGLHERFQLSKYVSSTTLASVLEDQAGRNVTLTILFSDIRGFTAFSERHAASEVVERLNDLLTIQTDLIIEHGGDVDKYVGDEVVALFRGSDGPLRAARCAIAIQHTLRNSGGEDSLRVGIGLHAGEVILGMVGSQKRADYTVIGDNVNLASRLCDVARRGEILISDIVRRKLPPNAKLDGPYGVSLKGKARKQRVYKLLALENQ